MPFLLFVFLLFFARKDLGLKWILVLIAVWIACLLAIAYSGLPPYLFMVLQVLIDIVLIIILFRDININMR